MWLSDRDLHDNRARVPQIVSVVLVFAILVLVAVLVRILGEIPLLVKLAFGRVFRRLPVGVAAMTRGRTAPLVQTGIAPAVEYSRRQGHVAGAPHRVAFADKHRNQDEQPEHHERNPQQ